MRTPSFLLLAPLALLFACDGQDGETDTDTDTTTGDDDDDTDTVPPGDDDDDAIDNCEVAGNVCTWLGYPGYAGFTGEGLPRTAVLDEGDQPVGITLGYMPIDVTFAPDGTAYYPDYNNHRIRRVALDGTVTTVSGTGLLGDGPNTYGSATNCWAGCDAMLSAWNHPTDVTVNPAAPNELFVSAWHNSRINIVDLDTNLMTWKACTGGRQYGMSDVDADGSNLDDCVMDLPSAGAFDDQGFFYFSDQANHLIRKIDLATNQITNVAGEPRKAGIDGDGQLATLAHIHGFTDQKADPSSKLVIHENMLYFADTLNGVIRGIDLETGIIDRVAGAFNSAGVGPIVDGATGVSYTADLGAIPGYAGDGGDALDAIFNTPRDIAVGLDGEIYIADTKNNCVRVVRDGIVDRFAGQCGQPEAFSGDFGPAIDAEFGNVFGVAVDPDGNVYVADTNYHVIRRVKR